MALINLFLHPIVGSDDPTVGWLRKRSPGSSRSWPTTTSGRKVFNVVFSYINFRRFVLVFIILNVVARLLLIVLNFVRVKNLLKMPLVAVVLYISLFSIKQAQRFKPWTVERLLL